MTSTNTPGFGTEFEVFVPAYFALKLNNTKGVQHYSIESNAKDMGNLDDVVIAFTKNKKEFNFALQLKHRANTEKLLTPAEFQKEGDFSLKKLCKSFKNMTAQDKQRQDKRHFDKRQFILYTNANFNFEQRAELTNFTMIQDDRCDDENKFFNTSSDEGNVYRFEVNDKTPQNKEITKSDYIHFFSRFRLFLCQKNFKGFEQEIVKILHDNDKYIVLKYLDLFRNLHEGRFTNKIIDKTTVNFHLIDYFLHKFVKNYHLLVAQNEKLKLFEKVVKEFDVTLIHDLFENFAENLVVEDSDLKEGVDEGLKEISNTSLDKLISFAQEHKMIESSVTTLKPQLKLKVLRYFSKKPIIVEFNDASAEMIYKIMELHQLGNKIKFILVGQRIQSARLRRRFRIFENVNDLLSNTTLYNKVIRTCCLSLQGRKKTTLKELIDSCEEIREHIGAKEILQMLNGIFLIGQAKESIPSFYVNRKVSFKVKTIDAFLNGTFFMKHLAVVKFDRKVEKIQNEIRKCNIKVVDVHNYLKSTKIPNKPTIISTNEEFSEEILQNVFKKSGNKSVIYLRISEDNGFLNISLEENQFRRLIRPVNILCADAGMGKTTMMKKLRNECDSRFWTIAVDLKVHNEFFKTKHDVNELFNHLIEGNENSFSKHIKAVFRSKKNIYFFFDGLDEVERSCVYNVLDSVKELSSEGFHVWISSRKNLKTKLEDRFDKVVMDMEDVEEEQQKFYIKNRLKREYNHEQIENLISKIFNSSDIDNNCQVLGKFLQLYIITQNFLFNKDLHQRMAENTFVLTKM
jgi:hypothetical protein